MPPLAVNVPVPVVAPLQLKATSAVVPSTKAGGAVTLMVAVWVQLLASLTCTVINPTPAVAKSKVVAVVLVVPEVVLEVTVKL